MNPFKPRTLARLILLSAFILGALIACAPTPTSPPTTSPTPARLIDLAQDQSIFLKGLIKAEQATLNRLADATVYAIDLQIADDLLTLQGQQSVRYTNREDKPLNEIYFQLFPNASGGKSTLSAVSVDGQSVNPVYEFRDSAARIPLPIPLLPGKQADIQMDFQVQVAQKMESNYGLFGYFEGVLALDEFYPVIPVHDQTGWHVQYPPPNADTSFFDASFYVVRVTAPAKLALVATGVSINQQRAGDKQILTFAAGPARDFYIAASEHYAVVSETVGETTINSYAFAERKESAQIALRVAKDALKFYSARLGEYPYTEFDIASTPMLALGIEYPGIIGITLHAYNPDEKISGMPYQVALESTVAHETAHQWFYNVVGNDQINEPWLDESVAQYVTGLYYLDKYGEVGARSYRDSWYARWDRVNRAAIPIGLPAASYQPTEYGAIVYGRGPVFLQTLAEKIGQSTFDKFLRDYWQSLKWGIGTSAVFKQVAERDCQCDLTPLFNEWVYGK